MTAEGLGEPRAHQREGHAVAEERRGGTALTHRCGDLVTLCGEHGKEHAFSLGTEHGERRAVFACDGH